MLRIVLPTLALLFAACTPTSRPAVDAGSTARDTGTTLDAGAPLDDGGEAFDAGAPDGSVAEDGGSRPDGGRPVDAGITCPSGYADCDEDPTNGCEINLLDDRNNCTRCGRRCPSHEDLCCDGSCYRYMCPS
jgi:hypothetical protein